METIQTRLHSIEWLASGILAFEFRPLTSESMPPVEAGSHIDVHLPTGMIRSYSLVNPGETHRYVIGVNRDDKGRGGSRYMHESLHVGEIVTISAPRNTFPLNEDASNSVFIAGGIGITPLWSMIQKLSMSKTPWHLYYSARSREIAAYATELEAAANASGGTVTLNFDGGDRSKMLNLGDIVTSCTPGTHFYCCGPGPMIQAFDAATKECDPDTVHREYFAPPAPAKAPEASASASCLTVHLARSQKTIEVPTDTSILDAVLNAGVEVSYSCMSGICGACETKVLEGTPDHQDFVLSESEQSQGKSMMICCSRAKTPTLTLDL